MAYLACVFHREESNSAQLCRSPEDRARAGSVDFKADRVKQVCKQALGMPPNWWFPPRVVFSCFLFGTPPKGYPSNMRHLFPSLPKRPNQQSRSPFLQKGKAPFCPLKPVYIGLTTYDTCSEHMILRVPQMCAILNQPKGGSPRRNLSTTGGGVNLDVHPYLFKGKPYREALA